MTIFNDTTGNDSFYGSKLFTRVDDTANRKFGEAPSSRLPQLCRILISQKISAHQPELASGQLPSLV